MYSNHIQDQFEKISSGDDFDLGRIFRLILMQSKLVLALIILGASLSFANYYYTEKVFKVTSLMQISKNTSQVNPLSSLEYAMSGGSSNTDFNNISVLYKSRSNITRLIKEYKLNLISQNEDVSLNEFNVFNYVGKKSFDKKDVEIVLRKDSYTIEYDGISFKNNLYDLLNSIGDFEVNISRPNDPKERSTILEYTKPENLYHLINSKFRIESLNNSYIYRTSGDGLLKISYLTPDPSFGVDILNTANNLC